MIRLSVACLLLATATAVAQPALLQQRVTEELASEGTVLSRRNLALQIEAIDTRLLVSLIDVTTGKVVASTRVDQVPEDREAAVATLTHVVADLAGQVGMVPPPAPVAPVAPNDDGGGRKARELADLQFKRQSIRFGASYDIVVSKYGAGVHRKWIAYQGDLDEELEPPAFYAAVGRPDLAAEYQHRRSIMVGSYVAAGAALFVSFGLIIKALTIDHHCEAAADFSTCFDAERDEEAPYLWGGVALSAASIVPTFVGLYYQYHPHPITENQAKSMADQYNQHLRAQLGLPVVARQRKLRDLRIAPFVSARDAGGVVVGARF